MKFLIPHAAIAMAVLALLGGHASENTCLVVFAAGHLAVPLWAAWVADAKTATRAVMLGPVLVIGIHAVALLVLWLANLGGHREDNWITMLMLAAWAIGLLVYAVYCFIAYSLVTRARRK